MTETMKLKPSCVIFGGGTIETELVQLPSDAYLICADKGLLAAEAMGRQPDYVVGDFDSLGYIPKQGIVYPKEKDDTDMMLAVKHVCEHGFSSVMIYGGLGGRLDHTIANIQALQYLADHGVHGMLADRKQLVSLQVGASVRRYQRLEGWYFSLFSLTSCCMGVTITGTAYPMTDGLLTSHFPLGISNEITHEEAEVSLQAGTLLVIYSRD